MPLRSAPARPALQGARAWALALRFALLLLATALLTAGPGAAAWAPRGS